MIGHFALLSLKSDISACQQSGKEHGFDVVQTNLPVQVHYIIEILKAQIWIKGSIGIQKWVQYQCKVYLLYG